MKKLNVQKINLSTKITSDSNADSFIKAITSVTTSIMKIFVEDGSIVEYKKDVFATEKAMKMIGTKIDSSYQTKSIIKRHILGAGPFDERLIVTNFAVSKCVKIPTLIDCVDCSENHVSTGDKTVYMSFRTVYSGVTHSAVCSLSALDSESIQLNLFNPKLQDSLFENVVDRVIHLILTERSINIKRSLVTSDIVYGSSTTEKLTSNFMGVDTFREITENRVIVYAVTRALGREPTFRYSRD